MTTPHSTPEDCDRIADGDEIQEADLFRQTHRSYLDMLPYLLSGDSDDLNPEFYGGDPY
jgi:hypothetical protein